MNRIFHTSLVLALAMIPLSALAQHEHEARERAVETQKAPKMMEQMMKMSGNPDMTMMHEMHMQKMAAIAEDPLRHAEVIIKTILFLKEDLQLAEDQLSELENIRNRYSEGISALKKELEATSSTLAELLSHDFESSDEVAASLLESGRLRSEKAVLAYVEAGSVKDVLSEEQWQALSEMAPMRFHRVMMINMSMMELMNIMGMDMMEHMMGAMQDSKNDRANMRSDR